jgi:NMD protein affecting ribosome stability and mRNA decay
VEELLVKEGWDDGSAVVDNSFYADKSIHRNLWNERNMQDGIGVEEAETKRAYVLASGSNEGKKKKIAEIVDDKAKEMVVKDDEEEIVFVTVEHPATRINDLDPNDLDLDALLA